MDKKPSDKGKERTECEVNEVDDAGLSQEEEEEEEFEDENQSQLDDLMAACTTIRWVFLFNLKKKNYVYVSGHVSFECCRQVKIYVSWYLHAIGM